MGTGGAKVFRHHGRSFVYSQGCNGYPEGLGLEVYNLIPKNASALDTWANEMRDTLDKALREYDPGLYEGGDINERLDIYYYWNPKSYDLVWLEYVYEINLDAGVFCYQDYPAFHLGKMPPQDVFLRVCRGLLDTGHGEGDLDYQYYERHSDDNPPFCTVDLENGEATFTPSRTTPVVRPLNLVALHHMTPEEYRLGVVRFWAPSVEDKKLSSYDKSCSSIVSLEEMQDILDLRPQLSKAEELCLYLLRDITVIVAQHQLKSLYRDLVLTDPWCVRAREDPTPLSLACMSLLPFTALCESVAGRTALMQHIPKSTRGYWFPRRHICYTTGMRLEDACITRYYVSRLVDHIMKSSTTPDAPKIVFGVVFSVFHCIVVRVDVANGGTFQRTEVLDFLPPSFKDSDPWGVVPPTPGMIMMTRLGHLPAADDVQFFHAYLFARWLGHLEDLRERFPKSDLHVAEPSATTRTQDSADVASVAQPDLQIQDKRGPWGGVLPLDILSLIASSIDNPQTLLSFSLVSKATMTASIPRLRYPQYISQYAGCRIRRSPPDGGIFVSRVKDSDGDLFPTQFRFTYDGGLASLQFMVQHDFNALRAIHKVPHHRCKGFPLGYRDSQGEHLGYWDWTVPFSGTSFAFATWFDEKSQSDSHRARPAWSLESTDTRTSDV